jgi:hypothetical protein
LETWYDWLAFVPRHRLGQLVPMIGDRKFASIVQRFLHEYGEVTIDCIQIVAPYEEYPNGHPRVRARKLRYEMAEAQMPANIKNFDYLELRFAPNIFSLSNKESYSLTYEPKSFFSNSFRRASSQSDSGRTIRLQSTTVKIQKLDQDYA